MPLFEKNEYLDWRNSPVHEEFLKEVLERIDDDLAELGRNAGENPQHDRKLVGRIEGLKQLVDWVPTIEEELTND
jgi:hypothetical protein